MDLTTIQDKLNQEYASPDVRLIFWFDAKGEYEEDVANLKVNAKLHRLTHNNVFYTKHLLESEDRESKYLIYAPFAKPADDGNHLADTIYYSKVFSTDKVTHLCADLGIPDTLRHCLDKYPAFWKSNARIEKFTALGIDEYTPTSIDIGILSVLAGVKTPNLDEILRAILYQNNFKDSATLLQFKKMGADDTFWQLCQTAYGYHDGHPTIERLVMTLLLTYTAHLVSAPLPASWDKYSSSKKNNIVVFMGNYMNSALTRRNFDLLAEAYEKKANAREYFNSIPIDTYMECDTFSVIDDIMIDRLAELLSHENLDIRIGGKSIVEVCTLRMSGYMHYSQKYRHEYQALLHAYHVLLRGNKLVREDSAKKMIERYQAEQYLIDQHYRKFYFHYDQIDARGYLQAMQQVVEAVYTNEYIDRITSAWSKALSLLSLNEAASSQERFYARMVRHRVGKERTVVIVSDALRYECAAELCDILQMDEKREAKLDAALSVLPSITKLGMASLLPHENMTVTDDFKVLLDGQTCFDLATRQSVLKRYSPDSICIKLDQVLAMKKAELRELCKGKDVLYVYHDQIDARGDDANSENEVFVACEEAIGEIARAITKLTDGISATYYIVTADHGFIYRRNSIPEHEKIDIGKPYNIAASKRYIVTDALPNINGTQSIAFPYMQKAAFVTVPLSGSIFKVAGSGQNYVHGGASLQEMLVPVLTIRTQKGMRETINASLTLISAQRRISNLITYIEFVQSNAVSDMVKATSYQLHFEDNSGGTVSGEVIIEANSSEPAPEQRMYKQRFTLKNQKYSKAEKYYLVVRDLNDTVSEPQKYEYQIDIAFSDDFGFGF